MIKKSICVLKCKNSFASGWGVEEDGTIKIEVDKHSWNSLEETAKKHRMNLDFILAEAILSRFCDC